MKKLFILAIPFLCASVSLAQPVRKFQITPTNAQFNNVTVGKGKDFNISIIVDATADADVDVTVGSPKTTQYSVTGATTFTVTKGTTHTVTLHFAPTSVGIKYDTLYITHNGDTSFSKNPTRIRMSGTGIKADTFPKISIMQATNNLGAITVGKTATRNVIIKNVSDTERTLVGTISSFNKPEFKIVSGGSFFSLAKGDSVVLAVSCTPTVSGNISDSLFVTTNSDSANKTRIISFSAVGDTNAKISVVPAGQFFSFGNNLPVGQKVKKTLMIINVSDTNKTLTGSITAPTTTQYALDSGQLTFTLARGDTQKIVFSFTPDKVGFTTDSIFISSNTDNANKLKKLTFFGSAIVDTFPKIAVTPTTLDFGTVDAGSTKPMIFVIQNISDTIRSLTGTVSDPKLPFAITLGNGTFSLDTGKSLFVNILFSPTKSGTFRDTIFVANNSGPATKNIRVILLGKSGTSTKDSSAKISIVPSPGLGGINFGTVPIGSPKLSQSITITNVSDNGDSLIYTIAPPSSTFTLVGGGGTFTIKSVGGSRTETVEFTPTTAGTFSDFLVITSNTPSATNRIIVPIRATVASSGVNEDVYESSIILTPNPVSTKMTIHFSLKHSGMVSAAIFDLTGKEMVHIAAQNYSVGENTIDGDYSSLASGEYFVRITTPDGTRVVKLVKE